MLPEVREIRTFASEESYFSVIFYLLIEKLTNIHFIVSLFLVLKNFVFKYYADPVFRRYIEVPICNSVTLFISQRSCAADLALL